MPVAGMAFTLASRSELELQSKCGHHHVNTRVFSFFFLLLSMNSAAIIIIISLLYSSSSPPMLSLFSLQLQQSPQLSSIIHIPPDKTNKQLHKNLIILSAFTFLFPSTIRNKQHLNVYTAIGKKSPQHSIFMSMLVQKKSPQHNIFMSMLLQRNLHNTAFHCRDACTSEMLIIRSSSSSSFENLIAIAHWWIS
jgi:hypothetical protein